MRPEALFCMSGWHPFSGNNFFVTTVTFLRPPALFVCPSLGNFVTIIVCTYVSLYVRFVNRKFLLWPKASFKFFWSIQTFHISGLLLTWQHLCTVLVCLVIINILYHWLYPSVACCTPFCFRSSLKPVPKNGKIASLSVSPFLLYKPWLQKDRCLFFLYCLIDL